MSAPPRGARVHKWWGWGDESTRYDVSCRPKLWPWLARQLELSVNDQSVLSSPVDPAEVQLPPTVDNQAFGQSLQHALRPDQMTRSASERLLHSYGRSYRDLVRLRAGVIQDAPDAIVYPESHKQVVEVLAAAAAHDVCVIPFGGGTNIVGAVESRERNNRMVVTLDMRRMNRMLEFDAYSMTARFEGGVYGPDLEDSLREFGVSLGHFPDSFEYSTLGGWLATRSAGTQSNTYGKIEDMVVGMSVVTPSGVVSTKTLPAASHGPDVSQFFVGSEGTLGIITGATMRVHPVPEYEQYRAVLFRTFENGLDAVHACVRAGCCPAMVRLSDERETEFIAASRPGSSWIRRTVEKPVKVLLRARGYDQPSLLLLGFEGPRDVTIRQQRQAMRVMRGHGGVDLGSKPGWQWKASRFDLPYLRDYLLDYACIVDSVETSTSWADVLSLHDELRSRLESAAHAATGRAAYVGCHISHVYATGACVYFIFGVRARGDSTWEELIQQYDAIKHAATTTIMESGAALSHHHAVGYEHQPWITEELSDLAVSSLRAVKNELDPTGIMNPGNLLP